MILLQLQLQTNNRIIFTDRSCMHLHSACANEERSLFYPEFSIYIYIYFKNQNGKYSMYELRTCLSFCMCVYVTTYNLQRKTPQLATVYIYTVLPTNDTITGLRMYRTLFMPLLTSTGGTVMPYTTNVDALFSRKHGIYVIQSCERITNPAFRIPAAGASTCLLFFENSTRSILKITNFSIK